ncbi:MAG: ankyrin repeat domain-containing protein, partial [Gammaproteobacteria bacterium]
AARGGHVLAIEKLVASGADLNAVNAKGYTALYIAVHNDHFEAINKLMSYETIQESINVKIKDGKTPWSVAFDKKNIPLMIKMIEKGVDFAGEYGDKKQSLMAWAVSNNHMALVKTLVLAGASFTDISTPDGDTLLHIAIRHGWNDVVKAMLAHPSIHVCLSKENNSGKVPLDLAVDLDRQEMRKLLLDKDPDHSGPTSQAATDAVCVYAYASDGQRDHAPVKIISNYYRKSLS